MSFFPKDPKKLKTRIRTYERALKKPNADDGYGKRFLVGAMYLLLADVEGANEFYHWYGETFPHDIAEPLNHATWALALYRAGKKEKAGHKLLEAALENPHIWDWLHGTHLSRKDIWYGTNFAEPEYLAEAPDEYLSLWKPEELAWAHEFSTTDKVVSIMKEQNSILEKLNYLAPGEQRSALVHQSFALRASVRVGDHANSDSNVVSIHRKRT